MATRVHALLFKKKKFNSKEAREWMKRNEYKPRKRVEKSDNYLRYSITPKKDTVIYRTISFGDDILAVLEINKKDVQKGGKAATLVQAILFEKDKFNAKEAREWLKKHDYEQIKRVDKTKNFLRYRLVEPKKGAMYRTIDFGDDIKAVLEIIRPRKNIK